MEKYLKDHNTVTIKNQSNPIWKIPGTIMSQNQKYTVTGQLDCHSALFLAMMVL